MENKTNIISDQEFLQEILSDLNLDQPKPVAEEMSEADRILNQAASEENENKNDTPPASEESKSEQEVDKNEEDIKLEEKSTLRRFGVKDTVNSLIENETWVDMPIKYGDKEYENITDLLDKEKPSKELFDLLSSAQKQYREAELNAEYVKVGDKDSTKAKLVNAILHDVDYTDLLQYNKEVVEPLQRIDFETIPNGDMIAEAFVKQCLVEIDNYHPESIDAVVAKLKSDFRLLEKAEEYQRVTIENFNREIEKRELEKIEASKREEEELKEQFKSLKTELKEKGLNDKFVAQLLKLRYAKDENGTFHYENRIKEKLKDKAFEAKLMHFLYDEDDFVTTVKSKVKAETSKKYLELINVTPKEKGSKETKNHNNLQTEDEALFEELGLLK